MARGWRARLSGVQQRAYGKVLDACDAPLGSVALREELVRQSAHAIPADGGMLSTHDPELGLITHSVVSDISCPTVLRWLSAFYPQEGALELLEMTRRREWSTTRRTPLYEELFRAQGIGHRLQVALVDGGMLWGSWWLVRDTSAPPFSAEEIALAREVAPRVAQGLRHAALRELDGGRATDHASAVPGVVAFDRHGRATLRDEHAAAYLRDLVDVDRRPLEREGQLPSAVSGALAQMYLRRGGAAPELPPADSAIRVRGESGRWYTVHASFMRSEGPEPGGQAVAVITPAGPADRASLLARLYGLTSREREVVSRLARGGSTKQVAAALGMSVYTVQEYVSNACAKVGVRRRRELLARLFIDAGGVD